MRYLNYYKKISSWITVNGIPLTWSMLIAIFIILLEYTDLFNQLLFS